MARSENHQVIAHRRWILETYCRCRRRPTGRLYIGGKGSRGSEMGGGRFNLTPVEWNLTPVESKLTAVRLNFSVVRFNLTPVESRLTADRFNLSAVRFNLPPVE